MRKQPWKNHLLLTGILIYLVVLFFGGLPDMFLKWEPLQKIKNTAWIFTRETSLIPGMELFRKKHSTAAKISGECFEVKGGFKTQSVCSPPPFRLFANTWDTMIVRIVQEIENIQQEKLNIEKRNALAQGLGEYFCTDKEKVNMSFTKSKKLLDGSEVPPSQILMDYDCKAHQLTSLKFSYEKN